MEESNDKQNVEKLEKTDNNSTEDKVKQTKQSKEEHLRKVISQTKQPYNPDDYHLIRFNLKCLRLEQKHDSWIDQFEQGSMVKRYEGKPIIAAKFHKNIPLLKMQHWLRNQLTKSFDKQLLSKYSINFAIIHPPCTKYINLNLKLKQLLADKELHFQNCITVFAQQSF